MVESLEVAKHEKGTPESARTDPGAVSLDPGGSQEGGRRVEPVTMLTLDQLRRFGPRNVRLALELRWPSLKRGGGVVPWESHQEARSSVEGSGGLP